MKQQLRFTAIILTLCALIGSCNTTSGKPAQSTTKNAYYDCGADGMAQRRAGAFERSKSCAVDAIGIGLAEAVQTAALAAGEARAIASAIKTFNQFRQTAKFNINIAKGALCAQTMLGSYGLTETTKFVAEQMTIAAIAPDQEYESLLALTSGLASGGSVEAYGSLVSFMTEPDIERAMKFAGKSVGSITDISRLFTTCTPIFSSVLQLNQLSALQLGKLGKAFAKIGVVGAIANCSAAGLFNAIDVGTEVNCLVQDLRYLEEQNKKILASERNRCEGLAEIASLPTSRPALEEKRNTFDSETGYLDAGSAIRVSLCRAVIERWGRCLASHPVALRSESYCNKLCTRASISTTEDFNRIAATTGYPDAREIAGLVADAFQYCTSPDNPDALVNDGNRPCINLCMQGTGGLTSDATPDYPAGF